MTEVRQKIKDPLLVQARQKEIIDAAQIAFKRKGFHATTVRDIAIAAGMTQGTLYNYIETKEDILFLVCDYLVCAYQDSVQAAVAKVQSPTERLTVAIRAIGEVMQIHQDDLLLIFQESHVLQEKALNAVLNRVTEFINFVIGLLRDATAEDEISVDNVGITANIITFLPTIVALRRWDLNKRGDPKEILDRLVAFMTRGLSIGERVMRGTPNRSIDKRTPTTILQSVSPGSIKKERIESPSEGAHRDYVVPWQLARTVEQTRWVLKSRYWSSAFKTHGLSAETLKTADDFLRFPYLTKETYRAEISQSPLYGGFLCAPLDEIERQGGYLFRTTGTTGKQTSIIKSRADLEAFATCGARNLLIAGARAGDYILMTFPYTMWTAAWGYYHGAPRIGATIIPAGAPLPTEMRISLLEEYHPRIMVATPSYALSLAESVRSAGRDPTAMGVEIILVGGEPISTARRYRIEEAWGALKGVRNFSGISEVAGVYLGTECPAQNGMHVYEDIVRCDVLVPGESKWAPANKGGELVVTSLVETALALNYRFRTGDFVYFTDEPCSCGRTSRRILSIESRLDDMRKIRGVNIWASAIEELLHAIPGVGDEFELVIERKGELDEITVCAEAKLNYPPEQYRALAAVVGDRLRGQLGIRMPVEIVPSATLPRYELKAKRWNDRRKMA